MARYHQWLATAGLLLGCLALTATPSGAQFQLGGAVGTQPTYEGSKDYRIVGFPLIAPGGTGLSDRVSFGGIDDIRIRALSLGGFDFGPVVGYRFGRDESDAARLAGLGTVDGGIVLGGYAAYGIGPLSAFAAYNHQVMGDGTGGVLRFGLDAKSEFAGFGLKGTIGATWASEDYMDSYFSVTASQAASSHLAKYDASAGIKDIYMGIGADLPIADRLKLVLSARYSQLVGEAGASPIVEAKDQYFAGAGLTYTFGGL